MEKEYEVTATVRCIVYAEDVESAREKVEEQLGEAALYVTIDSID